MVVVNWNKQGGASLRSFEAIKMRYPIVYGHNTRLLPAEISKINRYNTMLEYSMGLALGMRYRR